MSPCKAIAESRSSSACRKTRRRLPPLSHWRLGTKCSVVVSGGVQGRRGKYFCIVHHASVIANKLVGYTEAAGGRVRRGEEDKSLQKKKNKRKKKLIRKEAKKKSPPPTPNKAAAGEPGRWPVVMVAGGRSLGRSDPGSGLCRGASVGETGRVHVVVRAVREAPRPGEERQALGLLQHHLQLLEVLQPRHVLVLGATEETRVKRQTAAGKTLQLTLYSSSSTSISGSPLVFPGHCGAPLSSHFKGSWTWFLKNFPMRGEKSSKKTMSQSPAACCSAL